MPAASSSSCSRSSAIAGGRSAGSCAGGGGCSTCGFGLARGFVVWSLGWLSSSGVGSNVTHPTFSNAISTQACRLSPVAVKTAPPWPSSPGCHPITTRAGMPSWVAMSAIATAYCSSSPIIWSPPKSVVMRLAPCPESESTSSARPWLKNPSVCSQLSSARARSMGVSASATAFDARSAIFSGMPVCLGIFSAANGTSASAASDGCSGTTVVIVYASPAARPPGATAVPVASLKCVVRASSAARGPSKANERTDPTSGTHTPASSPISTRTVAGVPSAAGDMFERIGVKALDEPAPSSETL